MTTAHRPTFKAAIGGSEQGGNKILISTRSYSAKDLPAYLILKERKSGQGTQEELTQKDFKQDLLKREFEGKREKELKRLGVSETSLAIQQGEQQKERDVAEPQILKKVKLNDQKFPQDANDEFFMKSSDEEVAEQQQENSVSQQEDSNDDDEDEELMKEFQKIKDQRELEERQKVTIKQDEYQRNRDQEILKGNPLVAGEDYSLKKKWYEDTIFRNQARLETKEKQRFINDAVRSDFHKKFLNKYILM